MYIVGQRSMKIQIIFFLVPVILIFLWAFLTSENSGHECDQILNVGLS